MCDEYVVGDVVVGSVEQFEPGGPCFPSKLGTRLGAFKTVKAARAVVERPVFDLRHAPSEGETLDR